MEEAKVEVQPGVVKPKPKLHIWNQILEDDELSEKLTASMNKLGDEFSRRFIRKKRNKKNKKKKKDKSDSNTVNNNTNGSNNNCSNGKPTAGQPKDLKSEVKPQNNGQLQSKSQQSKKPYQKWNNKRQGGSSKKKDRLSNRVLTEEAENISKKLKEKRIDLIIRTIRFLGLDEAMKLCSEVLTIEEAGGLMTMNGTRRRTPGGIFFHLIRSSGRYDASIVSKLFKEGENKEPVFKSRKSKSSSTSATVSNASVANVTVEMKSDTYCPPIVTTESIVPIIQLAKPEQEQKQEPEKLTQPIDSLDLKESSAPVPVTVNDGEDVKMGENDDEDDLENSNLVIDEFETNDTEIGNTEQNSEQSIKCNFPNNVNQNSLSSLDLNVLCQPSPSPPSTTTINSELLSTINTNVSMFTTNRISVDA